MKKLILVLLLAVVLSVGAFADHPAGFGVGVVGSWYNHYNNFGTGSFNYGLSLKVPSVPVFWGINLEVGSGFFGLGLTGDYYFIDAALVPDINLHWFLGGGGWVNLLIVEGADLGLMLGARLPIGLSFQPMEILEIFLDVAPGIGLAVTPEFHFPEGTLPVELGVRLWF